MNVRNLKQKTPCQNLYGIVGKSVFFFFVFFFSKICIFENQLKRDIYTQVTTFVAMPLKVTFMGKSNLS